MSRHDESVSVLADRALPSASRFALRVATQIIGDEVTRAMNFEEHMINNCRTRSKLRQRGKWLQKIKFDQHRECRGCTHAGDIESDSDGPPELDWTHNSEDEGPPSLHPSSESEIGYGSQDERVLSTPLDIEPEDSQSKTIARNCIREFFCQHRSKSLHWK